MAGHLRRCKELERVSYRTFTAAFGARCIISALKLKDAAIAAGVCLAVAVIATLAVTLLAHSSLAYLSLTSNVFLKVSMVASVYLISQAIVIGIIPVLLKVNSVNSTGAEFVCIDCKQPILHPELKQAIQHLHFVLQVLIRLYSAVHLCARSHSCSRLE